MAHKTANKKKSNRSHAHRSNPTKVVVLTPKHMENLKKTHHKRRRAQNPNWFGSQVKGTEVAVYIGAGLLGMGVNKLLLPVMPASLRSNNFTATLTSLALALAEWWAGSFVSAGFGTAVAFGALMQTGNQALNAFVPSIGSALGLSGRRGLSDLIPGQYTVPQNPVGIDGSLVRGGQLAHRAYAAPYGAQTM